MRSLPSTGGGEALYVDLPVGYHLRRSPSRYDRRPALARFGRTGMYIRDPHNPRTHRRRANPDEPTKSRRVRSIGHIRHILAQEWLGPKSIEHVSHWQGYVEDRGPVQSFVGSAKGNGRRRNLRNVQPGVDQSVDTPLALRGRVRRRSDRTADDQFEWKHYLCWG